MEAEQGYVRAGNLRAHYRAEGEGAPVILIHGAGNDAAEWQHNIEQLSQHYRVYALDLPGYGLSDKPRTSYSLEFFTSFLVDFMKALGLEQASLMGVSLGGAISVAFALAHPQRVAHLVLANSACLARGVSSQFWLTVPHWAYQFARRGARTILRLVQSTLSNESRSSVDELDRQAHERERLFRRIRTTWSVVRNLAGMGGTRVVFQERLHEISCPTLIIWGAQDKVIPVRHAYLAHERITNSKLHVFEQCGHEPQRDRAADFNRVVLDFLNGAQEA